LLCIVALEIVRSRGGGGDGGSDLQVSIIVRLRVVCARRTTNKGVKNFNQRVEQAGWNILERDGLVFSKPLRQAEVEGQGGL
jgi:hypothetical protein